MTGKWDTLVASLDAREQALIAQMADSVAWNHDVGDLPGRDVIEDLMFSDVWDDRFDDAETNLTGLVQDMWDKHDDARAAAADAIYTQAQAIQAKEAQA